ncbi:MAG: TIR domain-containing protein, partial [Anaerolineae bacterium]|nr:TIR domain-containing protein [Anaerolineae bacterium]
MTDAFISYSRKDTDFVRQLVEALRGLGRETWVDWQGIDYSTRWWEEICAGIEGGDNFILIVSPDALNSVYCQREIAHARAHHKRIIPLVYRPLNEKELVGGWHVDLQMRPYFDMALENLEVLKSIQWIDYPKLSDFDKTVAALIQTVDTDPERVRMHTRLLLRLRDWEGSGRSPSRLLRGDELTAYEAWRDRSDAAADEPRLTDPQRDYIQASRAAEDADRQRQAAQKKRTRQYQASAAIAATLLVLALIGGVNFLNQARDAGAQADAAGTQVANAQSTLGAVQNQAATVEAQVAQGEARIQSLNWASDAVEVLNSDPGGAELAALLSIRALDTAYTSQADAALIRANERLFTKAVFKGHTGDVNGALPLRGGRILSWSDDSTLRLWSANGEPLAVLSGHTGSVASALELTDGQLLSWSEGDNTLRLWSAEGDTLAVLSGHTEYVSGALELADGRLLSWSADSTLRLWSAEGDTLAVLSGHTEYVSGAVELADGRLLSWSGDSTL